MNDSDKSPKCERMKSRNESFDNDPPVIDNSGSKSPPETAADSAQRQKVLGDGESDGDDDAFVSNNDNNEESEEDCLHFLDATQFLNNQYSRAPNTTDNQQQQQQRSSGANARDYRKSETNEFQDAVASSGALVGENILDSPSQYQRSTVSSPKRGRSPPSLP